MRSARLLLLAALLASPLLLVLQSGCSKIPDNWPDKPGPRVVTSFAPIYCFARNVAGDDAAVQCVMSEVGPHGFEPSPRDIVKLERAGLFLINGLMLDDDIAHQMTRGLDNPKLKTISVTERIPENTLRVGGVCREEGVEHQHGKYDPHVWLGIPEAIQMVERIRDALIECDGAHRSGYSSRAEAYIERLKKLQAEGKESLKDKKERKLVTFHDSLFYFSRMVDLEILDSVEPNPGSGASGKHLQELINTCRTQGVRHITVEPQYPSGTEARTIRDGLKHGGVDAEFVEIDTIETAMPADLANPDLYERKMRENFSNLAKGTPMSDSLLSLRDVHVELGGNEILRGVNTQILRGKITALIGLNGSGKTTLLRAILKEAPFRGDIRFHCGHDHSKPAPEHVGYVPQKLNIDVRLPLTVRDLLALAIQRRPLFFGIGKKARNTMETILASVYCSPKLLERPIEKLSGGELQRVLLGLALQPEPELLLLDEPASGVDFQTDRKFYELLMELNRKTGVTVLLVSHELTAVSKHADHVLCLRDGKIQCEGPPVAVMTEENLAQVFGLDKGVYSHHNHKH